MGTLLLNLILACVWTISIGPFEPMNFVIGFLLGYGALAIAWRTAGRDSAYFTGTHRCVSYGVFFLKELIVANIQVVKMTLGPKSRLRPGIIAVPVEPMPDTALTILANSITLTPGTLTLDIADDRSTLYVHCMHVDDPDAVRRDIKSGFEKRLLEIFT